MDNSCRRTSYGSVQVCCDEFRFRMCEVWTVSNTLMQKTAHGTLNSTKGRILTAPQPGQETAGADGKEIGCADSLL